MGARYTRKALIAERTRAEIAECEVAALREQLASEQLHHDVCRQSREAIAERLDALQSQAKDATKPNPVVRHDRIDGEMGQTVYDHAEAAERERDALYDHDSEK